MDPLMTGAGGANMTTRAWAGRHCVLGHKMKRCVKKGHDFSQQMVKEIQHKVGKTRRTPKTTMPQMDTWKVKP